MDPKSVEISKTKLCKRCRRVPGVPQTQLTNIYVSEKYYFVCQYPIAFGLPATVPGVPGCLGALVALLLCCFVAWLLGCLVALLLCCFVASLLCCLVALLLAHRIWTPCGSLVDSFFMTFGYLLEAFWHLLDALGDLFWTPGRLRAHFGPGVQKVAKKLEFG